jgi:asparagine N-glycosylation enzyme membrane subunit Stt3
MHLRSEQLADYIADRLEFVTFLACCSALLALLTGMNGQQALAFTALNLPFGLALLLGLAMLAPLPVHWRLPGIALLLVGGALLTLQLGGDWLNPLAIWSLYALLGLEILWQSRPRARLAIHPRG